MKLTVELPERVVHLLKTIGHGDAERAIRILVSREKKRLEIANMGSKTNKSNFESRKSVAMDVFKSSQWSSKEECVNYLMKMHAGKYGWGRAAIYNYLRERA